MLSLALHAWSKGETYRWEMLWGCHVASLILALGFLFGWTRAIALGFLFHVALGFPMWAIECITKRWISPTSVLVHVLPPLAGWLHVRSIGLPRNTVLSAWLLYLGLIPVSAWLTPPELNVNLAFEPWGFFKGYVPQLRVFQAGAGGIALAMLVIWSVFLDRWRQRNRPAAASG
ncbi:MAG TPA: hypothetical protein VLE48_13850 [Terriglobales bacterium]|nr:hypothetical protein [Terriglobales bacterium]